MSEKTLGEVKRYLVCSDGDMMEHADGWWCLFKEAQAAADAIAAPLLAENATLRHDLLNEQAASRMAHEVVARNRALEAENAQLRHALANAQVAAGFAKEMVEKSKAVAAELISLAMLPDSYPSTALRDHIRRILRKLQP